MTEYLQKNDILQINRIMIEEIGGNFVPPYNLLNEDRLDYLLEIVETEMFGEPLYPEMYHKAGVYMFNIIANHVFSDGNKRTGLEASILFLRLNGSQLSPTLKNEKLIDFTTEVASARHTLETVQNWFKENII